jgi:hypothetical protein
MNPAWLILIIPAAATLGYAACALMVTGRKKDDADD